MAADLDFERSIYRNSTQGPAPAGSLFETFADQVLRRVDDVLAGRDCPFRADVKQDTFLQFLRQHQGKRRAVSRERWCYALAISDREVREVVQSLRQDFGVAIGAAEDGGYFLVETEQEFADAIRSLRQRAVTILRVAQGISRGRATIDDLLHQLRLELSEEVR